MRPLTTLRPRQLPNFAYRDEPGLAETLREPKPYLQKEVSAVRLPRGIARIRCMVVKRLEIRGNPIVSGGFKKKGPGGKRSEGPIFRENEEVVY